MTPALLARITIRAEQCHGRPCIRGMRIRVVDILEMLAADASEDEILADFPRSTGGRYPRIACLCGDTARSPCRCRR